MKKLLSAAVILFLMGLPAAASDHESQVVTYKAEFIADLINKVDFDQAGDRHDTGRVLIYVVGESQVGTKLQEFAAGESGEKKSIEVELVSINDDLGKADILFLSSDDLGDLARVLKKVNGTHTLTVSDAADFARYGVMINFVEEDGSSKVKLEVNRVVLDNVGAKLDSDLLKEAILI